MILNEIFERVAVIAMPDSPHRARVLTDLQVRNLSDSAVIVEAVDGSRVPPPDWWYPGQDAQYAGQGRKQGAWGCWASHHEVIRSAIAQDVGSVLILEEDVVWQSQAALMCQVIKRELPTDWEQIYLGGQYNLPPQAIPDKRLVQKATSVNRTHAYALSRAGMRKVMAHLEDRERYQHYAEQVSQGGLLDHYLELGHRGGRWQVLGLSYWAAGQGAGQGGISGPVGERWWHPTRGLQVALPVVVFEGELPKGVGHCRLNGREPRTKGQLQAALRSAHRQCFRHGLLPGVPVRLAHWLPSRARVLGAHEVEKHRNFFKSRPFPHPAWGEKLLSMGWG